MSEPEMVMVEEHYSTVIQRGLSNRLAVMRGSRTDSDLDKYTWAELWTLMQASALKYGQPTLAGNFPVFLRRSAAHEGDTCDEGDIEIARVSESYARAIDEMRRDNICLKPDGTIVYLSDPVKRTKYLELIGCPAE